MNGIIGLQIPRVTMDQELDQAKAIVFETLKSASSQNVDVLKPAEEKLKQWEAQPGFYSVLVEILLNHNLDVNVRMLAALYFKNGVDRYWRRHAPNGIPEEEKVKIRQWLLMRFDEPVNQIALQMAVMIGRIARFDCPRDWPTLIPTLMNAVKVDNDLHQHRAMLTLHHVIKTLSVKRLAGDRKLFQELTANLYTFVLSMWSASVEELMNAVQVGNQQTAAYMERCILNLKILKSLTTQGFLTPHESPDAREVLKTDETLRSSCEKYIIVHLKILAEILKNYPLSFVPFIHPALEFCCFYAFDPVGRVYAFERFLVHCMNLVKSILLCAEYVASKNSADERDPLAIEAQTIRCQFFTSQTLTTIFVAIMDEYLPLKQEDLELWETDPEAFVTDEEGEAWRYSLRPAVESLLLALFHEFRSSLRDRLLELLKDHKEVLTTDELSIIIRRDAIYNAAGLVAFDLFDEVDFDEWFKNTLHVELKLTGPVHRILRRRVIWLIGQWTVVRFSPELRPMLYDAILPLLRPDEDVVVRITAATTLKLAAEDFEGPRDHQMSVLHIMSYIIERVGSAIRPYISGLVQYLPMVWEDSAEHNMLRCAILTTLVHIVQSLGTLSEQLRPFLIPALYLATDLRQNAHVYLMEDGLDLWLAVIENSSSPCDELLQLYTNLLPILEDPPLTEFGTENMRSCLQITQAYILLSPEPFLKLYGQAIVSVCTSLMSDLKAEGILYILRMEEIAFIALPYHAPGLFKPLLHFNVSSVYEGDEYPMTLSLHLAILSRTYLHCPELLEEVVASFARNVDESTDIVWGQILDHWLAKMPLVTQPQRQKVLALALAAFMSARNSIIQERFCGILLNICEVLNDIMKSDDLSQQMDSLLITDGGSLFDDDEDYETENDFRRRQLALMDPVHNIALKDFTQSQLHNLRDKMNGEEYASLLQSLDCETTQQAREYFSF
ncbi:unnamed protein product [Darwinula stevensoni]|uniref:Importin N-terminal domain-containing protein n=1 Tax=Darwinula stevensoni TaxID=69355 RepID=A0A7R9A6A1_9CRUS|nr:unnamed protein product [Darwinula stevensoni]CAG0893849.1 unnamed protein product [Darwinula stevensoni]